MSDSNDQVQRVLLVTGMSGAGKTTALRVLEDLGWEAIDNFPVRLLDRVVGQPQEGENHPLAIGFDTRTRGFAPLPIIELVEDLVRDGNIEMTSLFLDCAGSELERRYNETRRRHPMAQGRPVAEGIKAEREILEPLRNWADIVLDTTQLSSNELQQSMRERFSDDAPTEPVITLSSFGFSRGMPPLADLVFDMRFVDNPHWVDELRDQTGLDPAVAEHIRRDPAFEGIFDRIRDLLLELVPAYRAQGKNYIAIAFGCTGGRHRSVFTAEAMAQALREAGFSPTVLHRNLTTRTVDQVEGPRG